MAKVGSGVGFTVMESTKRLVQNKVPSAPKSCANRTTTAMESNLGHGLGLV